MGCAVRQELGKAPRGATAQGLVSVLVSRRDLSLFGLFEIWRGGGRGKNSPFCNESRQKNSFPLPKCRQEGRGRKGGAAAAQPPLYLHFRAPDNKHISRVLENKALLRKQKLRFHERKEQ